MKTDIEALKRKIDNFKPEKTRDSLNEAIKLRNQVGLAEMECALNFDLPVDTCRTVKELIPRIELIVSKIEVALKRGK